MKTAEQQRAEDFKAVMRTAEGRRFVWHIVEVRCGVLSTLLAEANQMAFHEGRRSVGVEVWKAAQELSPLEFAKMWGEAMRTESEDKLHSDAIREQEREE